MSHEWLPEDNLIIEQAAANLEKGLQTCSDAVLPCLDNKLRGTALMLLRSPCLLPLMDCSSLSAAQIPSFLPAESRHVNSVTACD